MRQHLLMMWQFYLMKEQDIACPTEVDVINFKKDSDLGDDDIIYFYQNQ